MTTPDIPDSAYQAAAQAYDAVVNALLGNPAGGSALGRRGREMWVEHPAFRAAVEAVWPVAAAASLREAARDLHAMTTDPFDLLTESVGTRGPIAVMLWLNDRADQVGPSVSEGVTK